MSKPKSFSDLPSFEELPDKARYWVWGSPGSAEEGLGMLNLLTPQHVAACARSEIRTGERVGLGWEFHNLSHPGFGRREFKMNIKSLSPPGVAPRAFDDEYELNPQQSSQWDGLRHHSQPSDCGKELFGQSIGGGQNQWFGGTKSDEILDPSSSRIGIHHWAKHGIVGRGVLLDYASWAKECGIRYSSFSDHTIPLSDLKKVIAHYHVEIKPGDILFVRIGLIEEWENMSEEARVKYQSSPLHHAGIEPSKEILEWVWNSHFCAVASDSVSFEVYPQIGDISLHHYIIAGWGMPIGEMFNLDPLAKLCKALGRYSFFVSSVPFNAVGGVSSPPNAVAIF